MPPPNHHSKQAHKFMLRDVKLFTLRVDQSLGIHNLLYKSLLNKKITHTRHLSLRTVSLKFDISVHL